MLKLSKQVITILLIHRLLIQICITPPSLESTPLVNPSLSSPPLSSSITLSLQAQNLPFKQILPTLDFFYLPDCLHDNWIGPIMRIHLFLVSHFNFSFVPCGGLSWLPVSFLLHVKYTLSYRIVSYHIMFMDQLTFALCTV